MQQLRGLPAAGGGAVSDAEVGPASQERAPGDSPAAFGARTHRKEEQARLRDGRGEGAEAAARPRGQAHAEDAGDGGAEGAAAAERPGGHAAKEGQRDSGEEAGPADPREGGQADQAAAGED